MKEHPPTTVPELITASHIAFDLDMTIIDSAQVIKAAIAYALAEAGLEVPSEVELRRFIGPPLKQTLQTYHPTFEDEARLDKAIQDFRAFFNNNEHNIQPFPGILAAIEALRAAGKIVSVATSKPLEIATHLLELLLIRGHFDHVYGNTMSMQLPDGTIKKKEHVLQDLLEGTVHPGGQDFAMVGDMPEDMIGAEKNGIKNRVGVLWGNGTREALVVAGATHIIVKPEEITDLFLEKT